MAWTYLIIGGLLEIVWATAVKYSDGFTKLSPSLIAIVGCALSVYFLSLGARTIPIGTSYAVWTGIGAVGVAILGVVFLSEPLGIIRLACIGLIILGIVGLKLSS